MAGITGEQALTLQRLTLLTEGAFKSCARRFRPLEATVQMNTPPIAWLRVVVLAGFALLVCGCQSTRELMKAQGYPPAFVDGFEAGCGSGRQAAGALDRFSKDVPRYLATPLYAQGWDDGFRQCQAQQSSEHEREWQGDGWRDRDREWRSHVEQSMAQALRRN